MTSPGAPGYVPPATPVWQVKRNRVAFPPPAPLALTSIGPGVPSRLIPDRGELILTGSEVAIVERPAAVTFNAFSAGAVWASASSTNPPDVTWTHTASGRKIAVIVVAYGKLYGTSGFNLACTYGGAPMTTLGTITPPGSNGEDLRMAFFGILDAPSGAQEVVISNATNGITWFGIEGASLSYNDVGSFGLTSKITDPDSVTMPMTVSSATGRRIVQGFILSDLNGSNPTGYNQARRGGARLQPPYGVYGDAAGASSVTFTAQQKKSSSEWAAMATDLIPG